jgi:hypothetical protein
MDIQKRKTMHETYPHRSVSLVKLTLVQLDKLFLIFYETQRNIRVWEKKTPMFPVWCHIYAVHILKLDFSETRTAPKIYSLEVKG